MTQEHLLHVILPQDDGSRVLILPHDSGWTLPSIQPEQWPERPFPMYEFGMAMRSLFGQAVAALRCAHFERQNDEHGFHFVFVAEKREEPFQPPDGARWLTHEELPGLALAHDHLRPVLETYFHEQATGEFPPERAPWAFPGWEEKAEAWINAQIAAQGRKRTGEIELVRKWCITCVMKVPTDAGMLYFKAVPPTFAREVAVTRFLAERHPDNIPSIAAYDAGERWLLLRDFGKNVLAEDKEIAHWERALRDFAALQVDMMAHVEALLERGALDYRLEALPEKIDAMLADEALLRPDRHITVEEIERLRGLAPRLKEMLWELGSYGIPPTIVHSDFHVGNTVVHDGRVIFFDWTDTGVGHPFFDMAMFFENIAEDFFSEAPETPAQLREVYLQGLTGPAPIETLRKALPLGEALGLLHQAVNYHHLLRHIEPAERFTLSFVGHFLKRLLTRLDETA